MTRGGLTIGEGCARTAGPLAVRRRQRARRRSAWRAAAGALVVAGLAGAVLWLCWTPLFRISTIQTGAYRYTNKGELDAILRGALGRNIWSFSAQVLQARIESLPWVQSADVARRPPARLIVQITEWQPLLLLAAPEDQPDSGGACERVLQSSGRVVPWPAHLPPANLPLLRGADRPGPAQALAAGATTGRGRALLELMVAVASTGIEAACPVDFVVITPDGFALETRGERRRLLVGDRDFAGRLRLFLQIKDQVEDGPVIDLRFRNRLYVHTEA